MSNPQICPNCGAKLPDDAPARLCPRCLVAAGLESHAVLAESAPEAPTIDSPAASGFVPPSTEQLAGEFPQLEILSLLGYGGMGAVYKARQTNLDRLVALKIIRPEATLDRTFASRFNREAKTLARLSHQHIVNVFDFGEVAWPTAEDQPNRPLFYFIMEYVDGVNLRQLISDGKLMPNEALAIVPQICDALQYAHDEGVVHRDIKPENILIDKRGRVKIADFGLAKLSTQKEGEFRLTGTHQVMGTPRYMAPEQLESTHGVDHRADIYSLGVVFYEMLTGEAPMGHFDPPSKKVEVDVRLDEVVLRSLAREPARRYQHASEVKTGVEQVCGVHAAPPTDHSASLVDPPAAGDEHLYNTVRWPAIAMLVGGGVNLTGFLLWIWLLSRGNYWHDFPLLIGHNPEATAWIFFLTGAAGIPMLFSGLKMLQFESRRLALFGAVMALVPLSIFVPLTAPIGIWVLAVMTNSKVRAAFRHA
ncbi:serine/threonine-protein kinase [Aeoliella sp. ICT_H6.2]|uniref:Serine/threonine-protein kinase n=1 Tax=Aeoliella straminimaris TaxID=2954799 RepID=A0A9X2JIM5_9BACT|nr:serine/threonine-protein kinase [Aeoliella straminimaris]MCO6045853.1 serine/threonine-protein kinase [Aeoliella straminimaris]